jgi:threonine dehydrogenase-like Zn-dependent dehydrogenase
MTANKSNGKAETIDFSEVDVYDQLQEMTKGRGPDRCIDAVGCEAHGKGTVDAVVDKVKSSVMLTIDRAHVLREAIMCCRKGGRFLFREPTWVFLRSFRLAPL